MQKPRRIPACARVLSGQNSIQRGVGFCSTTVFVWAHHARMSWRGRGDMHKRKRWQPRAASTVAGMSLCWLLGLTTATGCKDDDDRQCQSDAECSANQTCHTGQCLRIECAPGANYCENGRILQCNQIGTETTLIAKCAETEHCGTLYQRGVCSATPCVANQPVCEGDVATICAEDGSGPTSRLDWGSDCSADGQVCYAGHCAEKLSCRAGERVCVDEDVYLCAADGVGVTLFQHCAAEACNAASATCQPVPQACKAGERFCQDGDVYQCRPSGSGSSLATECPPETPCQPSYRQYSYIDPDRYGPGGADCLPPYEDVPCTPNEQRCLSYYILAECNESGTSSTLVANCAGENFQCLRDRCAEPRCTLGAFCRGNELFKCAYGDFPDTGVDCGDDAVCVEDAPGDLANCKPKTCQPGQLSCFYDEIWSCDDLGIEQKFLQACPLDKPCDDRTRDVHCGRPRCVPGSTVCLANQLGPCREDGSALASVTTDCAMSGQICDAKGDCADRAVDLMGGDDVAVDLTGDPGSFFAGNAVCVDSTRKLTRFELALTLPERTQLEWYVSKTWSGFQLPLGISTASEAEPGSRFYPFTPSDIVLEAGACYLIGVNGLPNDSRLYFDETPAEDRAVSFGQVMGSLRSGPDSLDRTTIYQMRVTTEPL